jgi:hypothetical protein
MDVAPERFYYIPLPRLPRPRLPQVQPHIRQLIAEVRKRLPSWPVARAATTRRWEGYGYGAMMSAVVLVTSIGIGFAISQL